MHLLLSSPFFLFSCALPRLFDFFSLCVPRFTGALACATGFKEKGIFINPLSSRVVSVFQPSGLPTSPRTLLLRAGTCMIALSWPVLFVPLSRNSGYIQAVLTPCLSPRFSVSCPLGHAHRDNLSLLVFFLPPTPLRVSSVGDASQATLTFRLRPRQFCLCFPAQR